MVFLNSQAPNIMVWTLLCLGSNFLRKSILAGCESLSLQPFQSTLLKLWIRTKRCTLTYCFVSRVLHVEFHFPILQMNVTQMINVLVMARLSVSPHKLPKHVFNVLLMLIVQQICLNVISQTMYALPMVSTYFKVIKQ